MLFSSSIGIFPFVISIPSSNEAKFIKLFALNFDSSQRKYTSLPLFMASLFTITSSGSGVEYPSSVIPLAPIKEISKL